MMLIFIILVEATAHDHYHDGDGYQDKDIAFDHFFAARFFRIFVCYILPGNRSNIFPDASEESR